MESEPLCDLLPLAFEPTDTGLQAHALPANYNKHELVLLNRIVRDLTIIGVYEVIEDLRCQPAVLLAIHLKFCFQ